MTVTVKNIIPPKQAEAAQTANLSYTIELDVSSSNVNIVSGYDRTDYTTCYVTLEYTKS